MGTQDFVLGFDIQRGLRVWRFLWIPGVDEHEFGACWYRTAFEYAYEKRRGIHPIGGKHTNDA
jgi:hypothetical protein